MQANDAMRILGSAAAMGLLGGGSALAYNAASRPTLDEYGNTIESNDINPLVAALGGAAIGAASGYASNRLEPLRTQMNRPQGMSGGASQPPRQSPDIDVESVTVQPTQQAQAPIVQIVPANPMEIQNPMSPPGMKTVVVQAITKEPGQGMMEEALRLRELAARQQAEKMEADAVTRYQRQQGARRDMHIGGWNNSKGNYNTQYPEDNQYNVPGWDLVNPTPGAAQWQREAAIIQAQKKMM